MELLKRNKGKLIASSIVILLPMLIALVGEKLLPEKIAVHWGLDGAEDGFMNSSLTFLVLPAVLLAIHWLCMILTVVLDKNAEQNKKMFGLVFWIIPAISLSCCGMILATALGYMTKVSAFLFLLLGLSFIIIGNYMPKTTRNVTMGIKLRWTLANDDNWYATHRFAGKLYVVMGLLCLVAIPLPPAVFPFVAIVLILACGIVPPLYSYRFYRKQLREGTATKEDYENSFGEVVTHKKGALIFTVIFTIVLLIGLSVVMFTGKLKTTAGEDALTVKASFSGDLVINYDEIDAVEYRADGVDGERIMGFGSAKLLLGTFENEEFGTYTRYTYTGNNPCIVLRVDQKIIVLAAENAESTKELYENLLEKIAE